MVEKVATDESGLCVEETRLAGAAAAGDGDAFWSLYERYEGRAYNLAYRLTGSESDAADATQEAFLRVMRQLPKLQDDELHFGSCLFSATRNACYALMKRRRPSRPGGAVPEPDTGREPPLETQQEEVRNANARLPEHQRETLALRELEGLSYDEIGAIMQMNRNSVAQLISRGRINLRDELRGTTLATVVAPSPECERALPQIAAREDGQLEAGSDDDAWLDAHLAGCERCVLGVEAIREAGASYRAWAPIAVVPWLFEETMAKTATLVDADWSDALAAASASRADPGSPSNAAPASSNGRGVADRPSRRRAFVAAGLAALLLGGGAAAMLAGGEPSPNAGKPTAAAPPKGSIAASQPGSQPQKEKEKRGRRKSAATAARTATAASPALPTGAGGSAPSEPAADHQGASGLQPPQAIATPGSKPKPAPAPTPEPQPQPTATPTASVEAQPPAEPPAEEPAREHPSKGNGPPVGVPARGGPK
jgi:RNA polymerase sigma-70 factor (ECF subfamily)